MAASRAKLPLLLKGICHPDDVRRSIDGGIDGIYCSTHGGRQDNGGVGCLDMLPAVVEAAGKTPVLFDSGVRSGRTSSRARIRRHGRRDRPPSQLIDPMSSGCAYYTEAKEEIERVSKRCNTKYEHWKV